MAYVFSGLVGCDDLTVIFFFFMQTPARTGRNVCAFTLTRYDSYLKNEEKKKTPKYSPFISVAYRRIMVMVTVRIFHEILERWIDNFPSMF